MPITVGPCVCLLELDPVYAYYSWTLCMPTTVGPCVCLLQLDPVYVY